MQPDPIEGSGSGVTMFHIVTPSAREHTANEGNPIGSMYGIFAYIWLISVVNVGKYTIHGSYGNGSTKLSKSSISIL